MRYFYPPHMINQQHKEGGYWLTMSERLTVNDASECVNVNKSITHYKAKTKLKHLLLFIITDH